MYGASTRQKETAGFVATQSVSASVTVVSTLLASAATSSTVPVAGWIIGAGLTIAAGVIELVSVVKRRRLRESEAVAMAIQLGIPEAASMPGWIFDALGMGRFERIREGQTIEKKLGRGGSMFNPEWDLRLKLVILGTLEAMDAAAERVAMGLTPTPPTPQEMASLVNQANQIQKNVKIAEGLRWTLVVGVLGTTAYLLFSE